MRAGSFFEERQQGKSQTAYDNRFYIGDCLRVVSNLTAGHGAFADLVYLDPPFNTDMVYSHEAVGVGKEKQRAEFHDVFRWNQEAQDEYLDIVCEDGYDANAVRFLMAMRNLLEGQGGKNEATLAYLLYMTRRLVTLRAAMKPTASVYLHCDEKASHYLKLAMDAVFGRDNFRNEIVWKRSTGKGSAKNVFGRTHDILLFYAKTQKAVFYPQFRPYSAEFIRQQFKYEDEKGRFTADHTNNYSGKDATNNRFEFMGFFRAWAFSEKKMNRLLREGRIFQSSPKSLPSRKRYLSESRGHPPESVWADIHSRQVSSSGAQWTNYPTQKPLELLDRIIKSSSQPGDLVLDPFCGAGTTIAAAQELNRRFVGIDASETAAQVTAERMQKQHTEFGKLRIVGEGK